MTTTISGSTGITFPAGGTGNTTGTVVGTSDTQTLTAKTLTSPTITGAVVSSMASSVITSGTVNAGAANPLSGGTSISFTGIPSWVKRVSVIFSGVSLSSTANILIQVGSGSTTTSGYVVYSSSFQQGGTPQVTAPTDGFRITTNTASNTIHGKLSIDLITGTTYVGSGTFGGTQGASVSTFYSTSGTIALGGALDRVIITSTSTDTFDAGSINILYE